MCNVLRLSTTLSGGGSCNFVNVEFNDNTYNLDTQYFETSDYHHILTDSLSENNYIILPLGHYPQYGQQLEDSKIRKFILIYGQKDFRYIYY